MNVQLQTLLRQRIYVHDAEMVTQGRKRAAPYIRQVIKSGAYPHFARRVIEADDFSAEAEFESGLACLLDGIAAQTDA
jgi:hypothetical protein